MTARELRHKYISFFIEHGHSEVSGRSLIPENDPTVLFTTAGMHPLVPFILGEEHPSGKCLVNFQKCIRTGDIDEVGDTSHLTFFEMLGNWSLGDYFKEKAIVLSWKFLTAKEWLGINPQRLAVTVFAGDENSPRDETSAKLWKKVGLPEERIFYLPKEDNWWGPPGQSGPCGPDTEIFIDTGITETRESRPGKTNGKWLEIWNNVFMQYHKNIDGSLEKLKRTCVDTGMGIERTITVLQGKKSVYETELMQPLISMIEERGGGRYMNSGSSRDISIRIICDHIRSSCFILAEGIRPSNIEQGYILRRLIRRTLRHGRKIGMDKNSLSLLSTMVINEYATIYNELTEQKDFIQEELNREEEKFSTTLRRGEQEFEKILPNLLRSKKGIISGRLAFRLYDTYGFPLELSRELAAEQGLRIDEAGFQSAYQKHQQLSKVDSNNSFKGGLADHNESTTALHTTTHLLHEALRRELGEHVAQKGSNITAARLRFDFSHPAKLSAEEIQKVEQLVNEQIRKNLAIQCRSMTIEDAQNMGARALFGEKYDKIVKVYSIGDFSHEVCGGPHIDRTGKLGKFRIIKEQSSSQGVRRIKAILEN